VIVGTAAYPDERSMELASRRGLYLAEHHITLLGTNSFQWPTGVPYSFAKSRETLQYTWKAVADMQAKKKMLWTVGCVAASVVAFHSVLRNTLCYWSAYGTPDSHLITRFSLW
jgi:hypothetical protein